MTEVSYTGKDYTFEEVFISDSEILDVTIEWEIHYERSSFGYMEKWPKVRYVQADDFQKYSLEDLRGHELGTWQSVAYNKLANEDWSYE